MYESISKNDELENEMTLDMSYFWYSDVFYDSWLCTQYSRLQFHYDRLQYHYSSLQFHFMRLYTQFDRKYNLI